MDHDEATLPAEDTRPDFRWDGAALVLRHLRETALERLTAMAADGDRDPAEMGALAAEVDGVLIGLARYQRHPHRHTVPGAPTLWQRGSARVIDHGGSGVPLLVVPSMINRAFIMDLTVQTSRMRWLAANGFRPFLFDWGEPGPREAHFRIATYLEERLRPGLRAVQRVCGGGPVNLAGYCMGGPIALALAALEPERVGRVVALGTPWDFTHFPEHVKFRENRKALEASLMTMATLFGTIPPQVVQSFFAMRDLEAGARKFRRFGAGDPMDAAAKRFVMIEDWLNDGIGIPLPVTLECFTEWLVDNALVQGTWDIGRGTLDAGAIRAPLMVVVGTRDSVVPPACALPLATAGGAARVLEPEAGHLGIVLGEVADRDVWSPVRDFLHEGDG